MSFFDRVVSVFMFLLLSSFAFLFVVGDYEIWRAFSSKDWSSVQATLEEPEVISNDVIYIGKYRNYKDSIGSVTYHYKYANKGSDYSGSWNRRILSHAAYLKLQGVPIGGSISIYVNPTNPAQSDLFQGLSRSALSTSDYEWIFFLFILTISIPYAVWLVFFKKARR